MLNICKHKSVTNPITATISEAVVMSQRVAALNLLRKLCMRCGAAAVLLTAELRGDSRGGVQPTTRHWGETAFNS